MYKRVIILKGNGSRFKVDKHGVHVVPGKHGHISVRLQLQTIVFVLQIIPKDYCHDISPV